MSLPRRFERELRARGTFPAGSPVVVAASGGSDSTALLELLFSAAARLGFRVSAVAHVHHGLRGTEADEDADFVSGLAARHSVPFELRRIDPAREARDTGESLEAVARRLRYRELAAIAEPLGSVIATGHTADDRIETLLLRLGRGEGGLAGPKRIREDGVVRPLLSFSRDELRAFLVSKSLPWREDSTNRTLGLRARLRAEVTPPLSALFGPSLPATAGATLDRLADDVDLLDHLATKEADRITGSDGSLSRAALTELPDPLVRRILRRAAGSPIRHGSEVRLLSALRRPGRRIVAISRAAAFEIAARVRLVPAPAPATTEPFAFAATGFGELGIPPAGGALLLSDHSGPHARELASDLLVPTEAPGDLAGLVAVRSRRAGDRIFPLGSPGRRRLKEVLIDRKVPREIRDRLPVVTLEDEPIWIPGIVAAERTRIRGESRGLRLRWRSR